MTESPHWIAAYPLGLALNCIAAFVLNQFFGIELATGVLILVAIAMAAVVVLAVHLFRPGTTGEIDRTRCCRSFTRILDFA